MVLTKRLSDIVAETGSAAPTDTRVGVKGGADRQWTAASEGFLTLQQFGAVGDGSTNETSKVTTAFAYAAANKVPLHVQGGGTYIVDSIPLLSNLKIIGDGNTTFKLKNSAAGGMFVWPTGATVDNFAIRDLILDGNFAGQPGAPHNLIHSIFFGANDTCLITNSEFVGLFGQNIDGQLFGGNGGVADAIYTDCLFNRIRVFHHTQTAISLQHLRCLFEKIGIDNASNASVPSSGQGGAYGVALKGSYSTIRDMKVALTTTLQGVIDRAGFALTAASNSVGNNLVDGIEVDSGGVAHNFAFTIDTGFGNRLNNLLARNGAYNCDFEILNQVDLQGSNWRSDGDLASGVGMIFDGCARCKVKNYNYKGTTQSSDAIRVNSNLHGLCDDVQVDGYTIHTQGEGIRVTAGGRKLRFTNGYITGLDTGTGAGNCGIYMDGGAPTTELVIDGLVIDGCNIPWHLANLQGGLLNNITVLNATTPRIEQTSDCRNIRYSDIRGVDFGRQAGNTYGLSALIGSRQLLSYYAFPVHGGTIGTITLDPALPAGAVVRRAYFQTIITPTSATNAATISFGLTGQGGPFPAALAAVLNANSNYIAGNMRDGSIDGSNAAAFFSSGNIEANPTMTIAGQALTAGFILIFIDYDVGLS